VTDACWLRYLAPRLSRDWERGPRWAPLHPLVPHVLNNDTVRTVHKRTRRRTLNDQGHRVTRWQHRGDIARSTRPGARCRYGRWFRMPNWRTVRICARVLLALFLAFLAACAPAPKPLSADPAQFALTLADLPKGYQVVYAGVLDNTGAMHIEPDPAAFQQLETQWGRQTGYDEEFARSQADVLHAPLAGSWAVTCYVDRYASAAGAQAAQHWFAQNSPAQMHGWKATSQPISGLGDVASAELYTQTGPLGLPSAEYQIYLARDNYYIEIHITGLTKGITLQQAIHYAQIVDARIHAAE